MSTPLQIITLRAPDYAAEPNVNALITLATEQVSDCFGGQKNTAIALIVLHWIALSKRDPGGSGVSGTIKSEKEGDLARSYGSSGSSNDGDPYYSQTTWGLEYIRLMSSTFIGPRNRFIDVC